MTNEQARDIFNRVIAQQTDPDKVAQLELAREYFTNGEFRKDLQDFVWRLNNP